MFIGEYTHALDAKGRVSVPRDFREVLRVRYSEPLVITRGLHGHCLWGFPAEVWEELVRKLMGTGGMGSTRALDLQRWLLSRAAQCHLDKAGRVLLTPKLRKHAQIERDVCFVGLGSRIELWHPALWEEAADKLDDDESALALLSAMAELGL